MTADRIALVVLTAGGFLATLTFVVLYARSRWWGTPTGRHMMTLSALLCAIFGLLLASRWIGGLPRPVWMVAMGLLDLVLWGQVVLLLRVQRKR